MGCSSLLRTPRRRGSGATNIQTVQTGCSGYGVKCFNVRRLFFYQMRAARARIAPPRSSLRGANLARGARLIQPVRRRFRNSAMKLLRAKSN